jgi:flagellar hook-associated protein 3 FlgL
MIPVSTYSQHQWLLGDVRNNQSLVAGLSRQVTSGRKSVDVSAYRTQTARLLSARDMVARHESFIGAINLTEPRVKVYDVALTALQRVAASVSAYISGANTSAQATDINLDQKMASAMNEVRFYLNQTYGSRHIFSGARYGTEPVGDITALAAPAAAAPPAQIVSPALTAYDTQAPANDANAWAKESFTADDGLIISYGINSQDPAFQDLVMAMRYAKAAANDPANFDTYMNGARQLIETARSGLQALSADTAANLADVKRARDHHNTVISALRQEQDKVENIDLADVSTRLAAAQTQLEATFAVTARLTQTSLVNFLSPA